MATTTISASDLTKLRSEQWISDLALHITPLVTVQAGTITAVPTTVPYVSVTWDGSTSGIEIGQMVKITNGATVRAYGVIRKLPSGSTLFISTTSLGNPGYTGRIESPIQVGDTATVYSHHPLWGLFSTIRQRTFYKSYDVPYTDQNEIPPPVSNAGTWQSARISSGTAAFTLPRSGSNTSFAFGAATISTYLWTLPAGVTLQGGFATSDPVIGVDAVAGTHLVKLKVTDSSSKVHTAYVWLFVSDGTTGTSLSERFAIDITGDSQDQQGRTLSFIATGTGLDDSILYPGAGILLREFPLYDGSALSDGASVDTFVGYITDVDYESDGDIGTATVTAVSPAVYAGQITQPPQRVTEKASPSNWTEAHSILTNPRGLAYYIIKWHCPALLDMHDFDATLTTPRKRDMSFDTDSLGSALQVVAQLITGNIGSASDGTTVMRRNPVLETNATRNALDTVITWTDEDLKPELQYRIALQPKASKAYTGAFIYDGTTTKAHRAVKRWYQGVGEQTLPDFIATAAQGLTYILEKVGHFMALQNRDISDIALPLLRNQDVIDPTYMLWNGLTSSSDYDPRGLGFTNERVLPISVERTWEGLIKDIVVTVQPETFGQPGEEVIIGSALTSLAGGWFSTTPLPYIPQAEDGLFGTGSIVIAINESGDLAVTYSLLNSDPEWISLNEKFDNETVCDADWDYGSNFITNGYVQTDALGLYVCTISATKFRVYRIPDVIDPNSVPVLLDTQTMPDSSANTNGVIACSETSPTLVIAAWKDQTGVQFTRSIDSGDSWTDGRVGSSITDTDNDDVPIGLAIWGTTILLTGPDGSSNYGLYKATSGGSFSLVTNSETGNIPLPLIRIASSSAALATVKTDTSSVTVDYDSGYSNYVNDQDGTFTTFGEAAVGNPDNALQGVYTGSLISFIYIQTTVTLAASVSITNAALDLYIDADEASVNWYIEVWDGGVLQVRFESIFSHGADPTPDWMTEDILTGSINPEELPVTGDEMRFKLIVLGGGGDPSHVNDFRLDNLIITTGGSAGETLYKVTTYTGSSVWADISPVADVAPDEPYHLAVDFLDADTLHMFGSDNIWRETDVLGASWATNGSSNYRVFLIQNDVVLGGGAGVLGLLTDGGIGFDSKLGNLATAWGSVGTIRKLLAL